MENVPPSSHSPEKRNKPRVACDWFATVQYKDAQGHEFNEETRAVNLSSIGICLMAVHSIQNNAEVLVSINLSDELDHDSTTLRTRGIVVRNESLSDKAIAIGVKFHEYKFV